MFAMFAFINMPIIKIEMINRTTTLFTFRIITIITTTSTTSIIRTKTISIFVTKTRGVQLTLMSALLIALERFSLALTRAWAVLSLTLTASASEKRSRSDERSWVRAVQYWCAGVSRLLYCSIFSLLGIPAGNWKRIGCKKIQIDTFVSISCTVEELFEVFYRLLS